MEHGNNIAQCTSWCHGSVVHTSTRQCQTALVCLTRQKIFAPLQCAHPHCKSWFLCVCVLHIAYVCQLIPYHSSTLPSSDACWQLYWKAPQAVPLSTCFGHRGTKRWRAMWLSFPFHLSSNCSGSMQRLWERCGRSTVDPGFSYLPCDPVALNAACDNIQLGFDVGRRWPCM